MGSSRGRARLSASSSARLDRWGSGGGGAGGGRAVVEVLQVQFIDKVVDVPMQLKFQQSRVPQIQFLLRAANVPVVQQKTVEIPQVQFLVVWEVVDMPVFVQGQVPRLWTNFLILYVKVDSDPEAASMEFHGSSHLKI